MSERTIENGPRYGTVNAPSSKSEAHRLLIAAALTEGENEFFVTGLSEDLSATVNCLQALGSLIETAPVEGGQKITVGTRKEVMAEAALFCKESGSTLRFLLPLAGALGLHASFILEDRLSDRPLSPLTEELSKHGMTIVWDGSVLKTSGTLTSGAYELPGNVSSQFITGLLFALPLLSGDSTLLVRGNLESKSYVDLTLNVLLSANIRIDVETAVENTKFSIPGGQSYQLSPSVTAEGDWSNSAFFLALGALSEEGVKVTNLRADSLQGDREVLNILRQFGAVVTETETSVTVRKGTLTACTIDASQIPDLVPVLSVVAALSDGTTVIQNASRLRLKESDRLKSTAALIRSLGGIASETDDGLAITDVPHFIGGRVDSCFDHRIAMSAAVAASLSENPVIIEHAEAVAKSFPDFFEVLDSLKRVKGGAK